MLLPQKATLAATCFTWAVLLAPAAALAEAPYPVEWTQQIGTSSDDWSISVAVDSANNAYISGFTEGNLEGTNMGDRDAFLVKFTVPEPSTLLLGTLVVASLFASRHRQE